MARLELLDILYAKKKSIKDFNWDSITAPPLLSILSQKDVHDIELICRDITYDSKISQRKGIIESILTPRGFKRMASGTNRVVYKFLEDQSFLIKASVSRAGLNDSPLEFRNQHLIKPFCTKVHEVSPYGALGSFERVENISSLSQYLDVAEDHFKLIEDVVLGKFIMADIGTRFYTNIGIRKGFGLVFVDFPMLFELDGSKLFCNSKDMFTGLPCGGQIDYDAGFNYIKCTKCGKQYFASRLAKNNYTSDQVIIKRRESNDMVIEIKEGNNVIKTSKEFSGVDSYLDEVVRPKKKKKNRGDGRMVIEVIDPDSKIEEAPTESQKEEVAIEYTTENEVQKEEPIESHKDDVSIEFDTKNEVQKEESHVAEEEPIESQKEEVAIEFDTENKVQKEESHVVEEEAHAEEPECINTEDTSNDVEEPHVVEEEAHAEEPERIAAETYINNKFGLDMDPSPDPESSDIIKHYESPKKISGPYPANIGRNMTDNFEEEIDSYNNSKGYPAKKQKKRKNKNFYDQY